MEDPVILQRNLESPRLYNGTRLVVKALIFIPRIQIIFTDLPFTFKRLPHSPLKLTFATTISEEQGQTLQVGGLHHVNQCFSHGLLRGVFLSVIQKIFYIGYTIQKTLL